MVNSHIELAFKYINSKLNKCFSP